MSRWTLRCLGWAAAFSVAIVSQAALAQTTSRGLFGDRTLGAGISSPNRTFAGGTAGGLGGLGAGPLAGGTTLAGATTQANASAGQLTGNERFLRGNRQPGQFVGADTADVANPMSNFRQTLGLGPMTSSGLTESLAALGRSLQGPNPTGNQQGSFGNNSRTAYRITRTVAFEYALPQPAQHSAVLSQRVVRALRLPDADAIRVILQGRTAILQGEVATEHARDLAERLLRLEPGVSSVQNELTVQGTPPADAPTP